MIADIIRLIRRSRVRMQLRNLERQSQNIIAARNYAMLRLMQVQRERDLAELEFSELCATSLAGSAT